jgi:microcin C transport system permease protein
MARREGADRFLFWRISPTTARRLSNFRANRRGRYSLWIFLFLFLLTLPAEFIANDKPLVVWKKGELFTPALVTYTDKEMGGEFDTEADFTDPEFIEELRAESSLIIWPLIQFGAYRGDNELANRGVAFPSAPEWPRHILGTDDQGRDVLVRVIYGFRISVLFGLALTILASIIGVIAGLAQGYYGGWVDITFQRLIEVWESIPVLFLLVILAAFIEPNFWWLLLLMLIFSWTSLVSVVRAETLRARNFDYVRAAKSMGATDRLVMFKHVLPNAMVSTLTFLPFILTASIVVLSSLDFLGYGLPPGSASLGELLKQGRTHLLEAPWLAITGFFALGILLSLLVFVGEAVRDAFDPRKAVSMGTPAEPEIAGEPADVAAAPAGGGESR